MDLPCTIMKPRYFFSAVLLVPTLSVGAQCTIDLPADTVTIYWGYDPLACTTLTPVANGAQPSTLLWSNGLTTPSIEVCDTASAWYFVTLTDDTLCTATDSVFVNVVDVHCGNNGNKVSVCHVPPGNPANAHTICISENGVPAHLAHGCVLGACAPVEGDSLISEAELQLEVSPNPLDELATVRVRSTTAQRVRVSVVDALGRRTVLMLDSDMLANEERVFVLDQSLLPQGTTVAWVEAQGNTERCVRQLVLVR